MMAKGRKKKPKGGRPSATKQRLSTPVNDVPYFNGQVRQDDVRRMLKGFGAYERWVGRGRRPEEWDPASYPPEYSNPSLIRGDDTQEFFRHSYYAYIDRTIVLGRSRISMVRGTLCRASVLHPDVFKEFCSELRNQDATHAVAQMRNANAQYEAAVKVSDLDDRFRLMLQWYVSIFEVDAVLWFLGCTARIAKEGAFNSGRYGGITTKVAQGSLLAEVTKDVKDTPLAEVVEGVYDLKLRNVIAHNDYRIESDGDGHKITCISNGEVWSWLQIGSILSTAYALIEATSYGMAYSRVIAPAIGEGRFRDRGIIFGQYLMDDQYPSVVLFQLWCFWELDPLGRWMDATEIEFGATPDGTPHIFYTDETCTVGQLPPGFLDKIEETGWLHISRIPIAPVVHKGVPVVSMPDGVKYEVMGPTDMHLVPARLIPQESEKNCFHKALPQLL